MTLLHRVLPATPVASLADYQERLGGGEALQALRAAGADAVLAELEASGLRGRGGAGFPTGRKWRTIVENRSDVVPTSVVVNAAEGEPGTFKDRALLRTNPYAVLEGALVAAAVVGAPEIVIGLKRLSTVEAASLRAAIGEMAAAGWCDGVSIRIVEGPDEYLYGEETALLESIAGRYPFPRLAPPYRQGVVEVTETDEEAVSGSGQPNQLVMAAPGGDLAPPALVDNVETLANVPGIVTRGAAWFRSVGTEASPGTILCTVTGRVAHPGVGEVAMGTPLRDAIAAIGGGLPNGHRPVAVLPGVSNGLLPAEAFATPLTYEDMAAAGTGLGSAGFIVLDERDDPVAVVAGASRFLAVESCGQCLPCKDDGLRISEILARLARNEARDDDLEALERRVGTVADGARCNLATQQQVVVASLLRHFGPAVAAHLSGDTAPVEPALVAELRDLTPTGAVVDERHRDKQPDWTYDAVDSGAFPAARLGEHRAHLPLED